MTIKNTLDFGLASMIEKVRSTNSPVIESPEKGLAINVDKLTVEKNRAEFDLLITGSFSETFCSAFDRLYFAPLILLQDVSGRHGALKPIDTHKRYPPRSGPNWKPVSEGIKGRSRTIWIRIPLWVGINSPEFRPSLFITAHLQFFSSNTLALDFKEGKVTSLIQGISHAIRLNTSSEDG